MNLEHTEVQIDLPVYNLDSRMAPGRTRTIDMKKRSSERRKIASQKAREARDAALNEESDTASEIVMDLDPSSIKMGNDTSAVGLLGLMQKMRAEFAMLAAAFTLQAREQVATLQAQLDAQATTIQKLLDEATYTESRNSGFEGRKHDPSECTKTKHSRPLGRITNLRSNSENATQQSP